MEETGGVGIQGREWVEPGGSGPGGARGDWSEACLKRKAWAQSRDSLWTETSEADPGTHAPSEGPGDPGRVPNKIASWLNECRTPLGASLDEQNICPPKGLVRNACSFEDDLSLGAEANHLQSSRVKAEPTCYVVAAQEKRSQFKLRGQSMNSTGSGKSSTVSSVSELLDLYEEDPEEILYNLGFGREEPDLASKVPSRFFNGSSGARGIDIKVYLGAQLQRMELENPNYALTSRFRQIEVLTTVANEFFQLYSQVSGNPVQRIGSREQVREDGRGAEERGEERGGVGEEIGGGEVSPAPLRRNNSALNVARILKKSISKHNLLSQSPQDAHTAPTHPHPHPGHNNMALVNGHAVHTDGSSADAHHRGALRKDSSPLATVTEESNGSSKEETDDPTDDRPEDRLATSATNEEEEPQSASQTEERPRSPNQTEDQPRLASQTEDQPLSANQTGEIRQRAPPLLHPHLTQLRTETKDSFEMEEVLSNEDETRSTSRTSGLIRTVSQQSDSSGFAEDPSTDSNSYLKVQDSSDSCDSETTVTSNASHDVATPLAVDQPAFERLADTEEVQEESGSEAQVHDGTGSSEEEGQTGHTGTQSETQTQTAQSTAASGGSEEEVESSRYSALLVQQALERARRYHNSLTLHLPGRGRGTPALQRSMSLPSSPSLCPSSPAPRMVSSLRIQVGRGSPTSVSAPQHSGDEPTNHLSTLFINPASSQTAVQSSPEPRGDTPLRPSSLALPKSHVTRRKHLARSSYSLQSSSPPHPDWPERPLGGPAHSWSTQSVPNLCSQSQPGPSHHHPAYQNHHSAWNSNPRLPMCAPFHSGHGSAWDPQTGTSHYPHPNASNSTGQHPGHYYNQHPYYTPPHHQSSPNHLYHPRPPTPHHGFLHQPAAPVLSHHSSLSNLEPPTIPTMPHQGYGNQSSPYPAPYASPYAGYHSYGLHPYPAFHVPAPHGHYPHPASGHGQGLYPGQGSPLAAGQGFYPGQGSTVAPGQGLYPGQGSTIAPGQGFYPGQRSTGAPGLASSTEMQLRRVLHDIRGAVQTLNQRPDTPSDLFTDPRSGASTQQSSLAELQQKRESLCEFRSHMMDLELSIIRQQALVYTHLSPADRLQADQLQALRSAVRRELQELEFQLEDRLHRHPLGSSVDDLSTSSALRAMEPVSDLLREQLFLQSELDNESHTPSTATGLSSRSSSPGRAGGEQKQEVYRASIDITPAPPPRPNMPSQEREDTGGEEEREGGEEAREAEERRGGEEARGGEERGEGEEARGGGERRHGGLIAEDLQQLIKEIRRSVADEIRQEILHDLLAVMSPRRSPLATREPL